jgi:uncharacterized protein (DUF58 family)
VRRSTAAARAPAAPPVAPEQALRQLKLVIVRRLEGLLHGEHLGLLPGAGTELAEARVYVPGEDDVRRMDWSVTARTVQPHVRDVIADRSLETWALVDLSESMDFGTATMEKRDLAIAATASLGLLTFQVGDRLGGYILNQGTLSRLPARSGRTAPFMLLRTMQQRPAQTAEAEESRRTLADCLSTVGRAHRKRGLRLVVSDFIDKADDLADSDGHPAWERPIRTLAARHQVVAVEIIDPRELDIPNVGPVLLRDPETGEVRELDTRRRKVRERYAAAARLQRQRTARTLRHAGVAHLVLRTDRDWVADIARFTLEHRRIASRLHRPPRGVSR